MRNKIKIAFAVLTACICLFSYCLTLSADSDVYVMDEWGMTVTIPEGFTVIDENTPEDHPFFDSYGYTKQSYLEYMDEEGIAFNAATDDTSLEYCLYIDTSYTYSYNLYSYSDMEEAVSLTADDYEASGASVLGYGIYEHPDVRFCWIDYISPYGTYALEYWTVHEYKYINLLYLEYGGEYDAKRWAAVEDFVSSVVFEKGTPEPEISDAFMGGTHVIDEVGLSITLPDGMHVICEDTPEDDPIFDILGSSKDEYMYYFSLSDVKLTCLDAQISGEIMLTVSEADGEDFTDSSDFLLNISKSVAVSLLENDGYSVLDDGIYHHTQIPFIVIEYYDDAVPAYGISYSTVLNGKSVSLSLLSYDGELSEADRQTALGVVDGMVFSDIDASTGDGSVPVIIVILPVIIVLLFIVGIVVAIIVIASSRRKKKAAAVSPVAEKPFIYCRNCGMKLSADSSFCESCGTEVRK